MCQSQTVNHSTSAVVQRWVYKTILEVYLLNTRRVTLALIVCSWKNWTVNCIHCLPVVKVVGGAHGQGWLRGPRLYGSAAPRRLDQTYWTVVDMWTQLNRKQETQSRKFTCYLIWNDACTPIYYLIVWWNVLIERLYVLIVRLQCVWLNFMSSSLNNIYMVWFWDTSVYNSIQFCAQEDTVYPLSPCRRVTVSEIANSLLSRQSFFSYKKPYTRPYLRRVFFNLYYKAVLR